MANEQRTLFDVQDGAVLRDDGITRAAEHAAPDFLDAGIFAVYNVARAKPELSTDEVWSQLAVGTHEHRAIGAVMREAAARGYIRATDRFVPSLRPECHRRPVRVWASLIWREQ